MWLILSLIYSMSCAPLPTVLPTEELVAEAREAPSAAYQLLYNSQTLPEAALIQQRVRILAWLQRMNLSARQLVMLSALRQNVVQRQAQLKALEESESLKQAVLETPIFNSIWDLMRQGNSLDSEALAPSMEQL